MAEVILTRENWRTSMNVGGLTITCTWSKAKENDSRVISVDWTTIEIGTLAVDTNGRLIVPVWDQYILVWDNWLLSWPVLASALITKANNTKALDVLYWWPQKPLSEDEIAAGIT